MRYHSYWIQMHPRGYNVTPPRGGVFAEIAPSLDIAKKWVHADINENRVAAERRHKTTPTLSQYH